MDFLDSIDVKVKEKKSSRVRSWYLYEQYKSLERNQLDAAQRLKERSYQDRILRQELSERRARRKLYEQVGSCLSESVIDRSTSEDNKTSLSASTDDFFESFCDLHDDEKHLGSCRDSDTEDAYSQDDSQTEKRYLDDFKSIEDIKDDESNAESVNSVVQNHKLSDYFTQDLATAQLDDIKLNNKNIAEEISLQFETVKENIQSLEKYSKLCEDKISEVDSTESFEEACRKVSARRRHDSDINLYTIWSKLVSFAYQVVHLNHGNCYYDYSSQFMTAVLACDVLRRGVNRMCHILQPYVSPIKYATDDESDASSSSRYRNKRKNTSTSKKNKKLIQKVTIPANKHRNNKTRSQNNKYVTEDYWSNLSKTSFGYNDIVKHKTNTEPWRSIAKIPCKSELTEKSSCSIWPSISMTTCECPCHAKVANPMLKIGQYIDRILEDIDDCKRA